MNTMDKAGSSSSSKRSSPSTSKNLPTETGRSSTTITARSPPSATSSSSRSLAQKHPAPAAVSTSKTAKPQVGNHSGCQTKSGCLGCQEHPRSEKNEKIRCPWCTKRFPHNKQSLLKTHMNRGLCAVCNKSFSCETRRKIHESLKGCSKSRSEKKSAGGHNHAMTAKGDKCPNCYGNMDSPQVHLTNRQCSSCMFEFPCQGVLLLHRRASFACSLSEEPAAKKLCTTDDPVSHKKGNLFLTNRQDQIVELPAASNESRQETCEHCGSEMITSWYRHAVVKYECDSCEEKFRCHGLFQRHLPCMAAPTAPFCGFCHKKFHSQEEEVHHHKQWSCDNCKELIECSTLKEQHRCFSSTAGAQEYFPPRSTKSDISGLMDLPIEIEQPEVVDLVDSEVE
ncbi:zinc finger protein 320-like [Neocloeon triangulifer]|uniref:zinc finger protein 320-like n=1 Tax=Neocloeon triangulifer TaxID=2078957 RepID=UPI00286F04AA|nr:zinc finger protein 320-like [Neocloeon triangulifer]